MKVKHLCALLGGALMLASAWGAPAMAQDGLGVPRVTITVPFAEGGGSDTLMRMIAPFLQQHLPGNPAMVVQNQPGGGGLTGTNQFYRSAQADGRDILAMSASVFAANLLKDRQIRFELDRFIPIYVSPVGAVIYVADETGAKAPGDVAGIGDARLVYGAASPTSTDALIILSLDLLGLNVVPVFGTQRGAARIAFERGEFTVDHQSPGAYRNGVAQLVAAGEAVPLMTLGLMDADGEIGRDPAFPDIPTFLEVYEAHTGAALAGPARDAWVTLFVASINTSKVLVLPPGTPDAVVATYVKAFEGILADPAFLERAKLEIGEYPQATGASAALQFRGASGLGDAAYEWLANWYDSRLGVSIRN